MTTPEGFLEQILPAQSYSNIWTERLRGEKGWRAEKKKKQTLLLARTLDFAQEHICFIYMYGKQAIPAFSAWWLLLWLVFLSCLFGCWLFVR